MAFNGIFFNGVWSLGFDFIDPSLNFSTPGLVDISSGTVNVVASTRGFGGNMIKFGGGGTDWIGRSFGVNLVTMYCGFWYLPTALPTGGNTHAIATWFDTVANAPQVSLGFNSTGNLQFYTGGGISVGNLSSPVGSASAALITAGVGIWLEFLVTIATSGGSVVCVANGNTGSPVCSWSGNTRTTANAWTNRLYLGAEESGFQPSYDDWYMLDNTGASPLNTYLGLGRIQTDFATSDATPNQWTPVGNTGAGNHYKNIANNPAIPGTDYNQDSNPGDEERYGFPAFASTVSEVFFMNDWLLAELDAAGARTIGAEVVSGGVLQSGVAFTPSVASYAYQNQPTTVDPNTTNPWASGTVAAAGSALHGVKVIT